MIRQDLISEIQKQTNYYGIAFTDKDIALTEKGRKTAKAIEMEVRQYIEDFSFLLNRKK